MQENPISRRTALLGVAALAAAATPGFSQQAPGRKQKDSQLPPGGAPPIFTLREGASRQFTTFDPATRQKALNIKPGEKRVLVNYDKPGILTRIWFTFNGWFWAHWESRDKPQPTILKKLILRIYWDGQDYPSVEAPFGDFFGIGHCEYRHYMSQYLGMSSGGFYSYFPMPFSAVRIEVENMHDTWTAALFMNINYQELNSVPPDAGRFHCLYNAGSNPGTAPLNILKAEGAGHFVGCCLSMQGQLTNNFSFLEAPEYVYIDTDDRSKPTLVGTGLEDYFNGGWYFREGEFAGPYHGVPLKDAIRSMISMYRFHIEDAICFRKNIQFDFLSPWESGRVGPFKFSSTAYWYQDKASRLAFTLPAKDKLVDWYRIRDTDHQSIP